MPTTTTGLRPLCAAPAPTGDVSFAPTPDIAAAARILELICHRDAIADVEHAESAGVHQGQVWWVSDPSPATWHPVSGADVDAAFVARVRGAVTAFNEAHGPHGAVIDSVRVVDGAPLLLLPTGPAPHGWTTDDDLDDIADLELAWGKA